MDNKEQEFIKRLLAAFKIEAEEHLKAITAGLLELEKESRKERRASIIEAIFREAHSLKGAARSVNLAGIEKICQSLESVFHNWKQGKGAPAAGEFDNLHQSLDAINKLLLAPAGGPEAVSENVQPSSPPPPDELEKPSNGSSDDSAGQPPEAEKGALDNNRPEQAAQEYKPYPGPGAEKGKTQKRPAALSGKEISVLKETVRISAANLDSLFRQAEELSFVKLGLGQYVAHLRETEGILELWKKQWARVAPQASLLRQAGSGEATGRDQRLTGLTAGGLLEFLDWNHEHLRVLEGRLTELERSVERDGRSISAMVDNLLADLKSALMFPASSLLQIFPKIVRELSRDQGKEVELVMRGGEVEIDRRILDEIKDPLIHLVRNAIDHGIEKPAERSRAGKPLRGTLTLAINQVKSNQVEILVSDDGAGIDLEKIKRAAVKTGVIQEKEVKQLKYQETLALIFESNVSTSSIITDISGRGLGLAIVREKVEKLGGALAVETSPQAGAAFKLYLPITLASFRAVLVQAGDQIYAVPTARVVQSRKIKKAGIKTIENRETISLNGRTIPLVRLEAVLELPSRAEEDNPDSVPVLILGQAEKLVAFSVDKILNEQEVLLKSLGRQLLRVKNIMGATVLGSGRVVPVLNVSDLIKSASRASIYQARTPVPAAEKEKRKSILVVEDSVTSRMLLKNILESAGFEVRTAVDGVDGFTQLRTADVDLVVSDVDMPRLNGFGLTSKIRGDKKLAELPVVLVTALEAREDRERGIEAGANAYIVKSTFDQSNLLEVIQRLI